MKKKHLDKELNITVRNKKVWELKVDIISSYFYKELYAVLIVIDKLQLLINILYISY